MEDVDHIILHFLRQLNINISDELKSLSELQVDMIIQSVSKCLITINPLLKVPKALPSGISHRIEVAAQLAAMCKDLGYKNEVGYQTFLYYNESDLRQVFMFLIECLPTENEQRAGSFTLHNKNSLLLQNIRSKIDEELHRIWIPSCCNVTSIAKVYQQDVRDCATNVVPNIEIDDTTLSENLSKVKAYTLIYNNNSLLCETKSSAESKFSDKVKNQDATLGVQFKYEPKKSLKELKEEAIVLKQKLNSLQEERNNMDIDLSKIQKACERAEAELNNIQNILIDLKHANIPLEGGIDNVLKGIRKNIELLHTKSDECTMKILTLKAEIDKNKNKLTLFKSERSNCTKTLLNLKETATSMKREYTDKENIRDQLKTKFEQLSRGNKRSIYTKRILEIISNVDKQKIEIKKILDDTRQIQKEINSLEGQLERSFSVADETFFKDAKKDDQAKKAYKLLALLHSECNTIVSLVNETGAIAREIVDLEDHIETEKAKRTEEILKRIQMDLAIMQEEKCEE